MSKLVLAESATVLIAPEAIGSLGTQPTSGWQTMTPDQAGIDAFYLATKTVAPSPITAGRQLQAPELVDADAMPKLTGDLTMDLLHQTVEGVMLAKSKHNGGTGLSFFLPTARTSTDYTVPALGALQSGSLVQADGFVNTANNGLFVVGASSTGTAVKVAGGVAETVAAGQLATLRVAGFRGASGDIRIDVNGNLTSTVADFTTMGLTVNQFIYVGGVPGTINAFATAGYSGFAQVKVIAANLLTLARRQWTVAAADTGTGKTIDLYFSRWLRNVAFTSADYQEQAYQMELSLPGIGASAATEFQYAQGMYADMLEVTSPATALIKAVMSFVGIFVTDPSTSRATGASTATLPLAVERFNPSTKERYIKITNAATEATVCADVMSWKIAFKNGVTGQKQQGNYGPKRLIVGKAELALDAEIFVTQDDAIKACTANTTLAFGAGLNNANGGVFFDVPAMRIQGAIPKFPANGAVMISPKGGGFVEPTGRYTLGLSLFAFLPAS